MYSRSAPRRRHGTEFKAKVLAACDEPGASISGVALANGLNANLVRQWRAGRGTKLAGKAPETAAPSRALGRAPMIGAGPEFVAVEMSAQAKTATRVAAEATPSAHSSILVELRRGPLHLSVRWPGSGSDECAAWLRELTSGVLR